MTRDGTFYFINFKETFGKNINAKFSNSKL